MEPDILGADALKKYIIPLELPSIRSTYNLDSSIPLMTRIEGNDAYIARLETLSNELLKKLGRESRSNQIALQRNPNHYLQAMKCLLHSLAYVASRPMDLRTVGVSLRSNDYSGNRQFAPLSYRVVSRIVDFFRTGEGSNRLVDVRRGTLNRATGDGVRTRLTPQRSLNDLFALHGLLMPNHPFGFRHEPLPNYLFLRPEDGADQIVLNRPPTTSESVIPRVNERLAKAEFTVRYPNYQSYLNCWDFRAGRFTPWLSGNQLKRQFKYDEQSGGRLFGHFVQTLPRDVRSLTLIDGEKVVEVDYQGMMAHLAYDLLQQKCPLPDPYTLPGYGEEHRGVFKSIFVRVIGSDPELNLESSLRYGIAKELGRFPNDTELKSYTTAFFVHHPKLRDLENTDAWRKLQYRESEIALAVLAAMEEAGATCIPIHDSFMVSEQFELPLLTAMKEAVGSLTSSPLPRK